MKRLVSAAALTLALASMPALAQDHSHMGHGDMQPPPNEHSAHGHGQNEDQGVPPGVAPPVPADNAADAFYSPAEMTRARAAMIKESGGMTFSQLMLDRLEYRVGKGADGYHWEGEGWIGGDINRFAFKTKGEGEVGGPLERAEAQALYSRAIDPWFNIEAGVRQDFGPDPRRTYAVVGVEGLAPYWFEVGAQAFLSNKGDAHLRLEASYDQRITQRLILQPAVEANIAAQDVPELAIGSGVSDVELGLRLRYEFAREFAPYVGVNWEHRLGDTARFGRARGEGASTLSLVTGIRFWF